MSMLVDTAGSESKYVINNVSCTSWSCHVHRRSVLEHNRFIVEKSIKMSNTAAFNGSLLQLDYPKGTEQKSGATSVGWGVFGTPNRFCAFIFIINLC